MTVHISVWEAAAHLPELAQQALSGEKVVIDLDVSGIEQVQLVPSKSQKKVAPTRRVPGIDEGRLVVSEDFNDPLPADILQAFEGG